MVSYALVGMMTWHAGKSLEFILPQELLWYVLMGFLIIASLGMSFRPPRCLQRAVQIPLKLTRSCSSTTRALFMGLFTPLLPCGLFYAAVATAMLAATPSIAALGMLVFATGTIPGLISCQLGFHFLQRKASPKLWRNATRITMLAMAGYIAVKQLHLI